MVVVRLGPSGVSVAAQPVPTARFHEKREAILAAAASLFNEHGVRGATLAGIAASVGLATNSVTYYYRKKEDLATACFLRAIAAYDDIARAASGAPRVAARIADFLARHAALLADIEQGREPAIMTFHDIRALPSPQADDVYAAYTQMFRRVRALLEGDETRDLARIDLNARAHVLLSVANWLRGWLIGYEADAYGATVARVADIVVRGIGGHGARWQSDVGADWQLHVAEGTSESFLRAATALVNEQGYRGASVDKISARLNVTKGSFYHHHDHKDDLISACFERSFAVMREAFGLAERGAGSGWTRASAAACALVRFQVSDGGPLLRASAVSALPDRAHRDHVRLTMHRLTQRMNAIVVDGLADGSIRALDPAIAAETLIAAINAAAELQRWVPGAAAGNVAAHYVRPAFEGLLCSAS
ncbi:MAG: TetR/AcrR family transcriptional regulator [Proteobacteria bacterium]|nr:TetR/AcrR family transcriptional regulator [Pseudomonadota bacterium]